MFSFFKKCFIKIFYEFKTSSNSVIQKTAKAMGNLIGNKTADKITTASKTSPENNLDMNEQYLEKNIYHQN